MESIIDSDVFLLVTARELSSSLFDINFKYPNNLSPRKTRTSLSFNFNPTADYDLKDRKTLTLSLETLQNLKKMATKRYMELTSQVDL